ncbi:MAG: SMI1/KNR4 family protein [Verrucomicrobiota bacterium]
MNYLTSCEPQINPSDILKIEERFQITLPRAYCEFLILHNGGFASSKKRLFDDLLFFSIGDCPTSLEEAIEENEIPNFIPFAETMNEDLLGFNQARKVVLKKRVVAQDFSHFVKKYLIKKRAPNICKESQKQIDRWIKDGNIP